MDSYYYSDVKIQNKDFNSEDLIVFKKMHNCFPESKKIKIILTDNLINRLENPELIPINKNETRIKISDIKIRYRAFYNELKRIALDCYILNEYFYDVRNFKENEESLIKKIISDNSSHNKLKMLDINNIEHIKKVIFFICFKMLNLKYQNSINNIISYIQGYQDDFMNQKALLELNYYKVSINYLKTFIFNETSKNFQHEVLLYEPQLENINLKNHFIREYVNYLKRKYGASYVYINYENKWNGIPCDIEYSSQKFIKAVGEIKSKVKSKAILYQSMVIKNYMQKNIFNQEEHKKLSVIIIKQLYGFDKDVYIVFQHHKQEK